MLPGEDPASWDHREEETYGLGGVRQPETLMEILGIHVKEHTMEGHLCKFVNSGLMHRLFTPQLRPDGMGIDYSRIDYIWVDQYGSAAEDEHEDEAEAGQQPGGSESQADDGEENAQADDEAGETEEE